jgi:hypothetical protein
MYFHPSGIVLLALLAAPAAEHKGEVTLGGVAVPGARVTAARAGATLSTVTDLKGEYSFPDLADGVWTLEVAMFGFEALKREIIVAAGAATEKWEMRILPLDRIQAEIQAPSQPAAHGPSPTPAPTVASPSPPDEDIAEQAADGLLINGSVNNGAASAFGQAAGFGNFHGIKRSLYTGGLGFFLGDSALDARPFSLTGQNTPKPVYSSITGVANFGGPLPLSRFFKMVPSFYIGYQWTRHSNATTATARVPTLEERSAGPISPQAQALLDYYPLPNFAGSARYNYQAALLNPTHMDALQMRFMKTIGSKNQISGQFGFQSTRADNSNLFDFEDHVSTLGSNSGANWMHRFNQHLMMNLGIQFSRMSTRVRPYFANRVNVSGQAGITGNNQDPMNWGPPTLVFADGTAGLSDANNSSNHNQTGAWSTSMQYNRRSHNLTWGGDFRRQQFNYLAQENPRGVFTFSTFGEFLRGLPEASSLAFGNADKYFRQSVYDTYVTDDWRISAAFTLNAGARWEYAAPISEIYGRLANLDLAPGFTSAKPGGALLRPFRGGIQPRVGLAWRPVPGSALVVRAGYGVTYDTSVYPAIALRLAQQPPLSKTVSIASSAAHPLTLANGFLGASVLSNTYAADPNFRPGYAQNWQLSVQQDLPGSMQMTTTYLGTKGTRGVQAFLPNTYPAGAVNPCPACPAGFVYVASNGNATRDAGQIQLRRRLRNGFTATAQYTYAKAIDNTAMVGGTGSLSIAQNWLDLSAERGLSSFDQRHLASVQGRYTTGMGVGGGTLLSGRKGAFCKDWTLATEITAASGLPQTPIYFAPVSGTGFTGMLRPEYTGAPLYEAPAGLSLNPAAYAAPVAGRWGNAGRNSITGPAQFMLNASLGRTFRLTDRYSLDLRLDSTNALNHVNYNAWNTTVNSAQFGLPASANGMRTIQTSLRVRF